MEPDGARGRNRTRDIFITSEVLYQLSYSGGRPILGRLAAPLSHGYFPQNTWSTTYVGIRPLTMRRSVRAAD